MNPLLLYLCIATLLLYVYLATGRLVSSKGCDKICTGVPSIVIIFRQVQKSLSRCSQSRDMVQISPSTKRSITSFVAGLKKFCWLVPIRFWFSEKLANAHFYVRKLM